MDIPKIVRALQIALPPVVRWSGAVAARLRQFNIAVDGKSSGNANTDALTLADLSVQELLVAALRDADPILRTCRIEGEETTGDMTLFSKDSPLAIATGLAMATRSSCICMMIRHRIIHWSLHQKWDRLEHGWRSLRNASCAAPTM